MAGLGNRKSTAKNNTANKTDRQKLTFTWGNDGPSFWQKENGTVLQTMMRKSDKNNYDLVLRIQNLDEQGKFVKNEDGTYDNVYFNLTGNELAKISYQMEQMFPTGSLDEGEIGGIIVNHISAQTNNGSQMEIVSEEDGVFLYITYVVNGDVDKEYKHLLSNDQTIQYYDNNGDNQKTTVNQDIVALKQLFNSAYALVSGLVDSVFTCNNFAINGRTEARTGGRINGGVSRKIRGTLGAKAAAAVSEDDDSEESDDEEEVKPAKKSNKITKKKSLASLLEDDDEDDSDLPFTYGKEESEEEAE